jgi:hypothetical protein
MEQIFKGESTGLEEATCSAKGVTV